MERTELVAMISVLVERRSLRMKNSILRGVLEDNLRILGRRGGPRWMTGLTLSKKLLFSLCTAVAMILIHGAFPSQQWFPESQIRAGLLYRQPVGVPDLQGSEGALSGEAFQALTENQEVPLWRLLGMGVKTIMIDPGHGGIDSGAIGTQGTMEKDLVLDIARRLKSKLEVHGDYRIVLTRDEDVLVPLKERVELALRHQADIFVSIHLNYLPQKPINIIETFYFGPTDDVKTARLAEKENASSKMGLNNFKEMVEKLNDELRLRESRDLAVSIQGSLYNSSRKHNSDIFDYGTKQAPFVVLLGVDVPSVLVEVSCLSNVEEEKKLNTESHRENIALYLETGILDYLGRNKGETRYGARR
jgi:N-acetylmuramoyl-L-alanine amidase